MKFCVPYPKGSAVTTPYRTTSTRATASTPACGRHKFSVCHELHRGPKGNGSVLPDPELDVVDLKARSGESLEGLEVAFGYGRFDLVVPAEGLFFFCRLRHRGLAFFQASS